MSVTIDALPAFAPGIVLAVAALRSSPVAREANGRTAHTSSPHFLRRNRSSLRQQGHSLAEARAGGLRHPVSPDRSRRSRGARDGAQSCGHSARDRVWRGNEVSVETVEHLLAALVSMGIDNVIVELNSPEVPIMDGSAAPFIYLIQEAGVKRLQAPRKYLKIVRPIAMSRGDKRIALYPSDHFKVTYSISYDHPLLRHQSRTLRITEESFVEEIAPARTFTFLKDVEMLRQNGLALGGSLENAIVLGETGVLNNAAAVRGRVRPPQDSRRGRRSRARRLSGDRPPGGAPGRPRAAHGVRGEDSRRRATPGGSSRRRPTARCPRVFRCPARTPSEASRARPLSDDERPGRRFRPAPLEPVDPFADQIELQR